MKAPGAVAKRPSRNVIDEQLELSLGYDPVLRDDPEQAKIKGRQRRRQRLGARPWLASRDTLPRSRDHHTDHIPR